MFRSEMGEAFALILTAKESGVGLDVVVPKTTGDLKEIISKGPLHLQHTAIADRCSR